MKLVNNENTIEKAHSIFSPSSAERHLNCTLSLCMERLFPDSTSESAEEGTAAHALGEWKARKALGLECPSEIPTSKYDCEDMDKYTTGYANYIAEQYKNYLMNKDTSNCSVMLERSVDISKFIAECFGTADCLIINDKVLHIIDLKYGINEVSAVNNYQLRLYALGALSDFDMLYEDIDTIRLTIYQPRVWVKNEKGVNVPNISTWEISKSELYSWANTYAKPRALMAMAGEGSCVEGKWCKYCKAQCICSLKRDTIVKKLSMLDLTKMGAVMSDEEIINVLDNGDEITNWIKKVKAYAEEAALNGDKVWNGYEVSPGKSSRFFISEKEVEKRCATIPDFDTSTLYTTNFISVAQLEKMLGITKFCSIFSDLVGGKPGKLRLTKTKENKVSKKSIVPKKPDESKDVEKAS